MVVVDGADSGEDTELTRARDLKKRAKKLMAQDLDSEDSEDVSNLLAESLTAIKAGNFSGLKELSDKLEDIIFYLEE